MFKKAGHFLYLLHACRLTQVSSWSTKAFLLTSRSQIEFEENNPTVSSSCKKNTEDTLMQFHSHLNQPVWGWPVSAFSLAFPPSILLQHQYAGNGSIQNWFGWNTQLFFGEICLCSHLSLHWLKLSLELQVHSSRNILNLVWKRH